MYREKIYGNCKKYTNVNCQLYEKISLHQFNFSANIHTIIIALSERQVRLALLNKSCVWPAFKFQVKWLRSISLSVSYELGKFYDSLKPALLFEINTEVGYTCAQVHIIYKQIYFLCCKYMYLCLFYIKYHFNYYLATVHKYFKFRLHNSLGTDITDTRKGRFNIPISNS